jgi:hypothetical protein
MSDREARRDVTLKIAAKSFAEPRPLSLERRIVKKNSSLIEIFALRIGVHNCNTRQKKDRYADA